MKTTKTTEAREHSIKGIRRAAVSLAAFETADPAETIKGIVRNLNGQPGALVEWDGVKGLQPMNDDGQAVVTACGNPPPQMALCDILNLLAKSSRLNITAFIHNAHRYLGSELTMQAVWNLRDPWTATTSTLILLCPAMTLPAELTHDVVVVTEPLPDTAELEELTQSIFRDAGIDDVDEHMHEKIVDTLRGVSAFAAKNALSMSITKNREIDRSVLWTHKKKLVEQTPGLSVWKPTGTMKDIGGLANLIQFLTRLLQEGVNCIGFIDEIEKLFAGASGDLSGVSQDALRVVLTAMQDEDIPGLILVGPPGTGKSLVAKTAGTIADAEVISIDTGAMTGGIVGESQAKIRKAFQTIKAVSQGKALFIATCNKIGSLPPELRRRFRLGTFYIGLPTKKSRDAIWRMKCEKLGVNRAAGLPDDEGWTGAEIEACVDIAKRTGMTLKEAGSFIVPVCKSSASAIEDLQKQASGNFIDADQPGTYKYNPNANVAPGRRFGN